jgi:TRAP-type C4-dicarboxylate transport system substrate-binding protein
MLGASPIKMNIGEVYLALQQGVIDGQENPFGNIAKWSWDEVQKYISLSRHVYTPITLVMNQRKYDSLTDEPKMHVANAARAAVVSSRQYGADNDANLEAVIRERSPDVEFNEIDAASFKEVAGRIGTEIGKIAGPEFTESFIAAANQ